MEELALPSSGRVKKKSVAPVYTQFPHNEEDSSYEDDDDDEGGYSGGRPFAGGSRNTQYLAALAANMGALALGTVLSWPAVALPSLRTDPYFTNKLTIDDESWIGSIVSLGAVAAGPAGGLAIELIGRRRSMLLLSLPFSCSWLLIHFAQSIPVILIARFLTGFFAGTFAVAAPIFTAEVTDVEIRGAIGSTFDMMISLGILFIYILGTFTSWRAQALICSLIPIIIFVMMLFVPESPAYLVKKGRIGEANDALLKYRGATSDDQVQAELLEMQSVAAYSVESAERRSWRELWTPSILIPVSIGFMIYMFQVLSGLDPVLVYTVDIFHSAGADLDEYTSTIIIGTIQTLAGVIAASVVDRSGRRFLLLISETFMIIALSFLGLYFYLKERNGGIGPVGLGWLPVTTLAVYVLSYSVGLGPVGYTIMGEILPLQVKGLAGCILTSAKWFMSFLVTKFFQDLILVLGNAGVFWLFGGFCSLGFFYILFFVPETRGKSLEEIQREFRAKYGGRRGVLDEKSPLIRERDRSLTYNPI